MLTKEGQSYWIVKTVKVAFTALGFLLLAGCGESDGSSSSPPPAPPPPAPPPPQGVTEAEASRFLSHSTFGPSMAEIEAVSASGLETWFLAEQTKPASLHLDYTLSQFQNGTYLDANNNTLFEVAVAPTVSFWQAAIEGDDQLRQRMAFALSQILVVSDRNDILAFAPHIRAHYMDILTEGAFGNYRDLLEDITYSPAMAIFLTYLANVKGDPVTGRVPDENYARELMQLFTIGLVELNADGTTRLDGSGEQIELYDNDDITELAKVFTGLSFKGGTFFPRFELVPPDALYTPLEIYPAFHSDLEKSFLNTTIPPNTGAAESIDIALDALFNHPNLPPFVSRQLIQRFVTSDPDPAYVQRVAAAFISGSYTLPDQTIVGAGVRGDLWATLAAILFDQEAIGAATLSDAEFGKVREPVIRFAHWARAFNVSNIDPSNEVLLLDSSNPQFLAQHPYRAPSVFNFYRPGYIAPGTATGAAELTAPELQIVSAASIVGYANTLTQFALGESVKRDAGVASFQPDYATEFGLANDAAALVDHLDLLLTSETMSAETRARILEALNQVPIDQADPDEGRGLRVFLAVLMAVTSPDYIVQK